jgi:osmotically inducible protein OsmC
MPTSKATAVWEGKLRDGKGTFRAASGAFSAPYTFTARFEGARGTTPEELLAAAHAACYSMALSATLDKAGTPVTRVETTAACTLEIVEGAPRITGITLTTRATVPGASADAFQAAAEGAKENCPVSKLFKGNTQVTLDARLT